MTEHLCVTCAQLRQGEPRVYEKANVCDPCRSRLRSLIREIDEYYDKLVDLHTAVINAGRWTDERGDHEEPVALVLPVGPLRSDGGGQRVSGSKDAPVPVPVDWLDLLLPARTAAIREPPCDCNEPRSDCRRGHPHLDQIGQISVASRLESWIRDWCDARGRGEVGPIRVTVHAQAMWLLNRLEWACDEHLAIDDFAHETRELASVLRRTVGASEVKPEHLDVPCRRCDLLDLHRLPGEDRIECGSCGCLMTETEFGTWTRLLAAHMKETVG